MLLVRYVNDRIGLGWCYVCFIYVNVIDDRESVRGERERETCDLARHGAYYDVTVMQRQRLGEQAYRQTEAERLSK